MRYINIIAERDTVTHKFKLRNLEPSVSNDIQDALSMMLYNVALHYIVISGYMDGHHYVIESITDVQHNCPIDAGDIEEIYECAGYPECITLRVYD